MRPSQQSSEQELRLAAEGNVIYKGARRVLDSTCCIFDRTSQESLARRMSTGLERVWRLNALNHIRAIVDQPIFTMRYTLLRDLGCKAVKQP